MYELQSLSLSCSDGWSASLQKVVEAAQAAQAAPGGSWLVGGWQVAVGRRPGIEMLWRHAGPDAAIHQQGDVGETTADAIRPYVVEQRSKLLLPFAVSPLK